MTHSPLSNTTLNTILSTHTTPKNIPLNTFQSLIPIILQKGHERIIYDAMRMEDDDGGMDQQEFPRHSKRQDPTKSHAYQLKKIIWQHFMDHEEQMREELLSEGRGGAPQQTDSLRLLPVFRTITEILMRRKPLYYTSLLFSPKTIAFNFRYCSVAVLESAFVEYWAATGSSSIARLRKRTWQSIVKQLCVELISEELLWQDLFCYRLLVNHAFELEQLLELVDVLQRTQSFVFIEIATLHVGEMWKQNSFAKHAPRKKQLYMTHALVLLLSEWSKEKFENSACMNHCILGIQNRLNSSIQYVRDCACLVAERVAQIMGTNKLSLDGKDHTAEFNSMIRDVEAKSSADEQEAVHDQLYDNQHTATPASIVQQSSSPAANQKSAPKPFNPDDVFDPDQEQDDESTEEDGFSTDTESLQSLADDDDEATDLQPVQAPKYLRDLKALYSTRQSDENAVEKVETGLKHGEALIRKRPDDIDQLSRSLCSLLLHLPNYNLELYHEHRHRQMVALVVTSTKNTGNYLCDEFYGNSVTISQRMDILEVLSDAALEMSNRNGAILPGNDEQKSPERTNPILDPEFSAKYPKQTRVWGNLNRKQEKVFHNTFVPHSKDLFYRLIRDYDNAENSFSMLGEDAVVLAKLLNTLGVFVFCCGDTLEGHELAAVSLDLVRIFMFHYATKRKEVKQIKIRTSLQEEEQEAKSAISVRRSVLVLLLRCVMSLPSRIIMGEVMGLIEDFIEWLVYISSEDADTTCRSLANHTLSTLKTKLKM